VFQAYDATPQARGAMQDIAYRSMRQLGRSETLLGLMTSKAPEPPMLAGLLCLRAGPARSAGRVPPPYEAFTVVDQAVGAAAAIRTPPMRQGDGERRAAALPARARRRCWRPRWRSRWRKLELPAVVDRRGAPPIRSTGRTSSRPATASRR
jgi:hypothetical protein